MSRILSFLGVSINFKKKNKKNKAVLKPKNKLSPLIRRQAASQFKSELKLTLEKEKADIILYTDFLQDLGDNFEQKRAVVSDYNRILVLAGAGSGKTKVLTKRFIHLRQNKKIPLENIYALTFTREAVLEMQKRVSSVLDEKIDRLKQNIRTFHSFCLGILKQNEQFDIISESEQRALIEKILFGLRENDQVMQSLYNYIQSNIIESIKIKDNEVSEPPQVKSKPDDFGQRRIKTNSGVLVRSKSERDIANFLSFSGIPWEYEVLVDWADFPFKPDFTLNKDVYLEHWCYDKFTPEFDKINKEKYIKNRSDKESQYAKHGKSLISVEEREMLDLQKLQNRLRIELQEKLNQSVQTAELFSLLNISPQYEKAYYHFLDELLEIINLSKSRLLGVEDLKKRLKTQKKEKVLYFYDVLIPVFELYSEILQSKDRSKKDFNDLIKDTYLLLKDNSNRLDYYKKKIKCLLIDEFQDMGYGEIELLKLLIDDSTYFFVVGDDWQSIYGWRGSEVKYILDFEKYFGPAEKIILPINYRSAKTIVDASTHFIQLNGNQVKKDIHCSLEHQSDRSKIIQLNAKDDFSGARYVIFKIKKLMEQDKLLKLSDFVVLYRNSRNILGYKKIFKQYNLTVPIRSIHWSKGTEFEYVFVLGLKGGLYGFPNVRVDKDIKRVILDIPIEEKEDEERRLFYVAMTRAKRKLFLISENKNESSFVNEIPLEYKYVYSSEK